MQITCSQANRISPVRCSVLFMRPLALVEKLADERCSLTSGAALTRLSGQCSTEDQEELPTGAYWASRKG